MAIAIVSAGIRFPQARTMEEYWKLIVEGRDVSSPVSQGRWPLSHEALEDPARQGHDAITHHRVYEVKDWRETSNSFGLEAGFLEGLDPLFHLCFGAGFDAWRNCCHAGIDRQRAQVILGNIALPTESSAQRAYVWLRKKSGDRFAQYAPTAQRAENNHPAALPAKLLSAALGFGLPGFTLDAACASSLYALSLACDALLENQADFVLAGGLSRPDSLYTQVGFTALQALSKSGRCYALDARADGLMVGEGAGIFGLKRLEDAELHGDQIFGVIRAVGLSNDREGRLMAPSSEGQLRAMRAAYASAAWRPEDVDYIECHATGTPLGDATEFESLKSLWQETSKTGRVTLGSVKPNVGHMLTAAGAAGLAKVLMAMKKRTLPPTANYREAAAGWGLAQSPFEILTEPRVWPLAETRARRAAISGFGFGGINAHLLVEEYDVDRRLPRGSETSLVTPSHNVVLVAATALTESAPGLVTIREQGPHRDRVVSEFQLSATDFRIPPAELREVLPQQLLGLQLITALGRSALDRDLQNRTACFVGIELDPTTNLYACRWALEGDRPAGHRDEVFEAKQNAIMPSLNANRVIGSLGSIVASRIARELHLGGPAFTLASGAESGLTALRLAHQQIQSGKLSVAFVMAVDASGSERGRSQWDELEGNTRTLPIQEGGVAWLVMREQEAIRLGLPVLGAVTPALWQDSLMSEMGSLGLVSRLVACTRSLVGPRIFHRTQPVPHLLQVDRPDLGAKESLRPSDASSPAPSSQKVQAAAPSPSPSPVPFSWQSLVAAEEQRLASHSAFLAYRQEGDALFGELLQQLLSGGERNLGTALPEASQVPATQRFCWVGEPLSQEPALFDYAACQEFARGSIARVFGSDFAEVDSFPTRVRLPDERLLLCHRVMRLEGVAKSLGSGFMQTEHDLFADAWYLEDGRMPTAIAVESGQADLMLSAYLGADFATKGRAVYRLLDARVNFSRGLPRVGEIIRYDIRIKRFFEQGGTLFFQFAFEASINGEPFMTMQDGCAGFFTEEALAAGRGIMRSPLQLQSKAGLVTGNYKPLLSFAPQGLDADQLDALRLGRYAEAFGETFSGLPVHRPKGLPGGDMRLVHRIRLMEDEGGRFGLGRILGEADIHPEDWFLTCHFVDDQVMPGTLMYECCLHTLRVLLMRKGWVGEAADFHFEPVQGIWSQLKCRGQVLASTQRVTYDIEIKEIGYRPEPYVICDALMSADDKPIVDITDMSLQLTGADAASFEKIWQQKTQNDQNTISLSAPAFSYQQILAFSSGKPSDCFGPVYAEFDERRRIARLPRPPFQFLDRIDWVEGPYMQQHVGTTLRASYDCLPGAWYWEAEGSKQLALAILVEIALQPCGFMAAYMGSALLSTRDLSFRNLSGHARWVGHAIRGGGALTVEVASEKLSRTGDMIIQDYRFVVKQIGRLLYEGVTSFGYFTKEALAQQVGLRGEQRWEEPACDIMEAYPESTLLSRSPLLMVDTLGRSDAPGGKYGLGVLYGRKMVDPKEWFFEAHFYQDPVMPGSLGLQALEQVLKAEAWRRWPDAKAFVAPLGHEHRWTYRGQVIPKAKQVSYAVHLKQIDEEQRLLRADAWLYCDGLPIYGLEDLTLVGE